MTLKQWASLSSEQQRTLVVEWAPQEDRRQFHRDLANQAAEALRNRLAGHEYVTDVHLALGDFYNQEPIFWAAEFILNVCTKESDPPRLELPKRFEGFRVCQFDYGPTRDAYLKTWKRLFKELKGWDEAQTLSWAQRYIDALEGGSLALPVYSHGPITTAVATLIDKPVGAICDDSYWKLYNEIRTMIWQAAERCDASRTNENVHHPDMIETYDWISVRNRYKELINEYNSISPA